MSSRFQEVGLPSVAAPCAEGRLPALFGYAGDVGKRLASLHVLVLAAGSVGFAIALLLARLGVGWLDIVDPKRLKPQSLVTHQGLRPEDVGEFKALAAARACAALGTGTRVRCFVGTSHGMSRADLAGVDCAIASPDNLAAELSMGDLCLQHGIPLIHAAVHGQTLVAQVRVYANSSADSPTPACGFTSAEREMLDQQVAFSCEGSPAAPPTPEVSGEATNSLPCLCSMAADLAVTQFLRHVLGLGEPVYDAALEWCAYTHRTVVTPIRCKGNCRCDHSRFNFVRSSRPLADCSPAELVFQADSMIFDGPPTLTLSDLAWAERGTCVCGRRQSVGRFVRPSEPLAGNCPRCGGALRCAPFFLLPRVPAGRLGPALDMPLRDLGAAGAEWALVRSDRAGTIFLNPESIKS